jgi:hypothetical protein
MEANPKIIVVNDKNTIFMIQEEFNQLFPYLKIDFFPTANKQHAITNKFTREFKGPLSAYRVSDNNEQLVITSGMSVTTLEEKFREIYDLKAQILRKSGKTWLETTVTDAWTLNEQNLQGEALSKHIS